MPRNSVAPLAFYFHADLHNDYSNLELISTISTMETLQKIYRPEIFYNANSVASKHFQPSLKNQDYSLRHGSPTSASGKRQAHCSQHRCRNSSGELTP